MNKYFLGIDIGSAFTKAVITDGKDIVGSYSCPSGGNYQVTADKMRNILLRNTGLGLRDIVYTVATGNGSKLVSYADKTVTDISCHGKGVFSLLPSVRTVVDIGDLYSKAFRIDGNGNLVNFIKSGKCAGGSARILTVIAKVLQLNIEELGKLSIRSNTRVDFNTGCAVFAESEVISRISEGAAKEDLLAGIHWALGAQLNALAERIGIERDYALVGGGARNIGLIQVLEEMNGFKLLVPQEPHMTSALGAAIIASQSYAYPTESNPSASRSTVEAQH